MTNELFGNSGDELRTPRPPISGLTPRRIAKPATCERHGEYEATALVYQESDVPKQWTTCPNCRKEWLEQRAEHLRRQEQQRELRDRLEEALIPRRFRGDLLERFSTDTEVQKQAVDIAKSYVAEFASNLRCGRCLIFVGGVGTGKTHLCCGMLSALVKAGFNVRYSTVAGVIRELRAAWRHESCVTETEILSRLRRYDLLVLDELGVQFGSEAERTQLTELIDCRYQDMKPTLIVSNWDAAGLKKILGERAVDRLRENGGRIVLFNWESHRGRVQPEESLTESIQ